MTDENPFEKMMDNFSAIEEAAFETFEYDIHASWWALYKQANSYLMHYALSIPWIFL